MGCAQDYTFMMTNDIKCENSTCHRCIKDDSSYFNKLFHCKKSLRISSASLFACTHDYLARFYIILA